MSETYPDETHYDKYDRAEEAAKRKFRRTMIIAGFITVLTVLTSVASIGGQMIDYREMRALEKIEQRCGK